MKRLFSITFFMLSITGSLHAQYVWKNPLSENIPVIKGQAWTKETEKNYQRIPERFKDNIPSYVWGNSVHSAGLSINFYSNSPEIKVRYTVRGNRAMEHMPATGVSGLDLYVTDCNGNTHLCQQKYTFKDTIEYTYGDLSYKNYHQQGSEYQLLLPLYNTVAWMEIGVPEGNILEFIPLNDEKPIVVYGTSIAHGGCASRPAMAWTNIVQRNLDTPFINMGFSGSGRLDSSVFVLLSDIDARMFIIDCMPNMPYLKETIVERMLNGVKILREKSNAPILIVEHDGYTNEKSSETSFHLYNNTNIECKKAFEKIQQEGVPHVYYMTHDEINMPEDGMVDCVHPTDLGMTVYAKAYTKKIRDILELPVGSTQTTIPCKQRREPGNYEWNERHKNILALNKQRAPEILMIGNSITHFWGGEPIFSKQYGKKSWDKLFKKKTVTNMGFGWDKIENVLWRVYHGEMDGYEADKIFLMIGTNNLNEAPDSEIVNGLNFLIKAIQNKQSKATIHIISILPRRNEEEHLRKLNAEIKASLPDLPQLKYIDVFDILLLDNGKVDESLFIGDGLHPNEKGYEKIASTLVPYIK